MDKEQPQEIMEIWKDISGYEGLYAVSNFGMVKSLERYVTHNFGGKKIVRSRILKIAINIYSCVTLSKNGYNMSVHVHRLVAKHFIDNPDNKPCVNHKNGNKQDCTVDNLEWVTYSENEQHSRKQLGKKSCVLHLSGYNKEWGSPVSINGYNFRSKNGKLILEMLKEGFTSAEANKRGISNVSLYSNIYQMRKVGLNIELETCSIKGNNGRFLTRYILKNKNTKQ